MNFKTLALGLAVASVATVSMAKPVAYTIDPTHSATVFSWSHFGFSTPSANFSDIQGTINVDNENLRIRFGQWNIPVASINTNVKALDDHIKTAEFLMLPNIRILL